MDWIHAHLVVNHGPVILAVTGSLAAIGLSGRMAAEQIGELIEGVEVAGSAAQAAAASS